MVRGGVIHLGCGLHDPPFLCLCFFQVQEAFALTKEQAEAAPKGYATELKGAGKVYQVYVHRCAGLGCVVR